MDLADGLRGSDKITITRTDLGKSQQYEVSLDDFIGFAGMKLRGVSKADIAGVLSRTLREKASVRHRHTAEEIDGIAEEIMARVSNGNQPFRFTKAKW